MHLPILQVSQLTTDRLLLRGFGPDDFQRYAEMMADPDVSRHLMDGRPLTRVEAWQTLALGVVTGLDAYRAVDGLATAARLLHHCPHVILGLQECLGFALLGLSCNLNPVA